MELLRRLIGTVLAFAAASAVAAIVVQSVLPSPSGGGGFAFFAATFGLTLLGPLLFAWAWGPSPMTPLAIGSAILIPLLSLGLAWLGLTRRRSLPWTLASALSWAAFGGFSAWVAISGSI